MFLYMPLTREQYMLAAFVVIMFSSLPDWDLKLGIRHRTITHSLLIPLGMIIASYFVTVPYSDILLYTALVICNHDLLDLLTWVGVPLLYPISKYKFKLYIWSYIPGFSRLDYDTQKRIYTFIVNAIFVCLIVIKIVL